MKKSKIGFYAEKSLIGISAFVIGWLLLCVIDINIHNMTDLNYSRWNLIRYLPNTGEWWWLCTPWSTKSNGYESSVAVVAPGGNIYDNFCRNLLGVRPVCILKSDIFES